MYVYLRQDHFPYKDISRNISWQNNGVYNHKAQYTNTEPNNTYYSAIYGRVNFYLFPSRCGACFFETLVKKIFLWKEESFWDLQKF